jgi:hypothetical protein
MAPTTSRLVLLGGAADLSFRDGSGAKRRVLPGVPFEVDADTAAILLGDPHVQPFADPDDVSARNDAPDPPAVPTAAELRARAAELGLTVKARDTKDELSTAIAAEEARLADEALASSSGEGDQEGDAQPADDPGADASGEAGAPPADTSGAIVLGDIPAGGKLGH